MKKKNERHIAILLAVMMIFMNFIITPVMADGGVEINPTNFPDATFMAYVKGFDTNHDDALSQDELNKVTKINVENKGITNLKGIEYFTKVTELNCNKNQLTTLDLSHNTELTYIYCDENQLTALDLMYNTKLTGLSCSENQLTTLDLKNNTNLEVLSCEKNQLTALDLKNKTKLLSVDCRENQLTTLDLSKNRELKHIYCDGNQLTALDLTNNTKLGYLFCNQNQLTTLDLSKNTKLIYINCVLNQLTTLDLSKKTNLETLYCGANQLTTLDLSENTNLKTFDCSENQLTALDLKNNKNLKTLQCSKNQLKTLDLSQNINLEDLRCYQNQLTALDLRKNKKLKRLKCDKNYLTNLDLSNNSKVYEFDGSDQEYDIKVSASTLKFDLRSLPGKFNPSNASGWVGGDVDTVDSNILKLKNDPKPTEVKYNYKVNNDDKNINVTLKVKYGNFVTVTFNKNGKGGEPATIVKTIDKGSTVEKPSNPTDEQFDFGGWYKEAECTTKFDFTQAVNASITLYAKWTAKTPPPEQVTLTTNIINGHGTVTLTPNTATVDKGGTIDVTFNPDANYEIGTVTLDGTDVKSQVVSNKLTITMDKSKTLWVTFKEKPVTPPPTVASIAVNSTDHKTEYKVGDPLDLTNLKIEATMSDGTKSIVPVTAGMVTDFDTSAPATNKPVTITYGGKITTFNINVTASSTPPTPTVESIAVNSIDHKTEYKVGEPLDVSNLTILVTMSDGATRTENVTAGMVSGFDTNTEGTQTLTITYQGKTTSYNVTVTAAPTPPPTPVTYTLTASVDGGHGSVTPTNATKNKDDTVTLTFTPETGYEIDTVKVNDVVTTVSGNTLTLTMDGDKTVVVKYKATPTPPPTPVTVIITFDKNGGTGTMVDVTKNKGEIYPLPSCGFTPPAGKEFKAWQVDGTEKNVGDNIVLNGDKNIKAVWKDIGSVPPTPPVPPTPDKPITPTPTPGPYPNPWLIYPGWYYNFEAPKPKEEKPVTKMEMDWKIELMVGVSTINREINGVQSKIKMDVAPYIRDGRTMLPIRYVAEALGFDVEWNRSTRTVVLRNSNTRVEIPVDTNKIIVNGNVYTSDVKPEIKNNRTMLPIANIARALGLRDGKDIIWNSKSKMVTIYRSIVVK